MKNILITVICCVISIYIYHKWYGHQTSTHEQNYARLVSTLMDKEAKLRMPTDKVSSLVLPNFVEAAAHASQAVVAIKAIQVKGNSWRKDKYSQSNGSGVLVDPTGVIVSNYHVVEDADIIQVKLEDRREFEASVIGYDRSTDLALLKIEASDLHSLQFGSSVDLQVGEWVLAVGNPFKLQSSVTAGIVSAKARNIDIFNQQGIESFIQTDAAINPGNSGGALINIRGELVGINTAILSYSGKYEGFSFAIPSSIVKKVVNDIRTYGAVQRAWLGVGLLEMTQERADKMNTSFVSGVIVDLVERDGAAREAGLRSGDILYSIDNETVKSVPEFMELISQYSPGDRIVIEYYRKGKVYATTAELKNQINATDYIAVRKDPLLTQLGFEVRDLDRSEVERLKTDGVLVVSIRKDSKIGRTNMDPSYIISHCNGRRIKSVDDLVSSLSELGKGRVELKGFYENWPGDYPYVFEIN